MAIVDITIVPLGTASTSLSAYVARVHQVVMNWPAITYQLTPMSTVVEGDLSDILALVLKMHEVPFDEGVMRVATTIRIDDRRDKKGSMDQKLDSVHSKTEMLDM